MKLLIEIPKEFERHFEADRFAGSLQRLSADAHLLAGLYDQETATMLIQAFKHVFRVPSDARLINATELLNDLEDRGWFDDADMYIAKRAVYDAHTIIPDAHTITCERCGRAEPDYEVHGSWQHVPGRSNTSWYCPQCYIEELIDLFEQHEQPLCDICSLRSDCPQGVTAGPNGPHYPACSDTDPRQLIDIPQAARLALELLEDASDMPNDPEMQRRGDPI